ncbi:hypothetical protein F4779DRAFT_323465 [Xylariaceae sp. FL0662B]|nr:hypothetical protein F4779DRAFT_323465 [Xylariaceae sp. FL0662B]
MSTKRKFSDFQVDSSAAGKSPGKSSGKGETRERIPGFHPPKKSKKNKKKSKAKPNSMNWVKKRVRTIERRFNTGQNMPANVHHDLERELAHHKQKIDEVADEKKRKHMIKKYHMIRFFERKKADRLAKQIRSQLETAKSEQEIKKLETDLHTAEVDSLYARYFPHREAYVSLYPVASLGLSVHGGEKPETASSAAQALHSERPPMWREIEQASKKGDDALVEIRERKIRFDRKGKHPQQQSSEATKADHGKANGSSASDSAGSRKRKGRTNPDSNDDDSDGGFFEED